MVKRKVFVVLEAKSTPVGGWSWGGGLDYREGTS